jgi:hypothetical protein
MGPNFESQAKLLGPIASLPSFSSVFLTEANEDKKEEGNWTCDRLSSNLGILLRFEVCRFRRELGFGNCPPAVY